jgi:hypothetical protein
MFSTYTENQPYIWELILRTVLAFSSLPQQLFSACAKWLQSMLRTEASCQSCP